MNIIRYWLVLGKMGVFYLPKPLDIALLEADYDKAMTFYRLEEVVDWCQRLHNDSRRPGMGKLKSEARRFDALLDVEAPSTHKNHSACGQSTRDALPV